MPFTAPIVSAAIAIGTATLLANFPAKLNALPAFILLSLLMALALLVNGAAFILASLLIAFTLFLNGAVFILLSLLIALALLVNGLINLLTLFLLSLPTALTLVPTLLYLTLFLPISNCRLKKAEVLRAVFVTFSCILPHLSANLVTWEFVPFSAFEALSDAVVNALTEVSTGLIDFIILLNILR